jgi:hypothetical protein
MVGNIPKIEEFYLLEYSQYSPLKVKGRFGETMKMKATCSSEMSVDFQRIIQHCVSEDKILHNHR